MTWQQRAQFSLIAVAVACLVSLVIRPDSRAAWQTGLMLLPTAYVACAACRRMNRLQAEKRHAQSEAQLHLRTVEALALAIEARDDKTYAQLLRVQTYVLSIGRQMGLTEEALNALSAAAVLQDIGKLAVPQPILSKTGKLTPEEFEKVKIHSVVGAEILQKVNFPYPVAPIVRGHHEKWNGKGYPDGLRGEEIPIGARILCAVDCLDALISDRPYRSALPLEEALGILEAEAGESFDPWVVEIIHRQCHELEALVSARAAEPGEPGGVPVAGLCPSPEPGSSGGTGFQYSIAAARREAHTLYEMTRDLGSSLCLEETLSVFATRLKRLVPFDSLAINLSQERRLTPVYVRGEDSRLLWSLEVPFGEGLSGWAAQTLRPVINGEASLELAYGGGSSAVTRLRSALAVPLAGLDGLTGVVVLYRTEEDTFTPDHLRILQSVSHKVAQSVENALKYLQAESSATTDYLTGLPNARSLFVYLEAELARARRVGSPLTVLVCDLDGFKQVNDKFGHLRGNRVLRAVAAALKSICRDADYVARMGGDEFVVVMPGLSREYVPSKVRQFRLLAAQAGAQMVGPGLLSLSIGAANCGPDGYDAESLLAAGDRRMYEAKQAHKSASTGPGMLLPVAESEGTADVAVLRGES